MLGFKIKYSHNFSKLLLTKSIVEATLKKMAAISKLEMTSITNLGVSKQKALLGNVNNCCFIQTFYKFSCNYFHLAAILKKSVAILKMEKSKMANEKLLTRKVQRAISESLTLVSGIA